MEQCACDVAFHLDVALNLTRIYFFVWIYIMQSAYFSEASHYRRNTAAAYWSHSNVRLLAAGPDEVVSISGSVA
jgi:hypothetical protein